ncbi:hypothetical protein BIV57_18160 [Mangrovactinospora gilvigrisea]|uniref:Uncharacterized protein n=1 Tax=Mangrovactinospora gilvigrisea TaxID=1428644 RepID=A0A1J7C3F6_9ACTN|nr:hypothetical protein [Mangrovactinospora gilvigrisea]OIV36084.1 hypothetical protein BIV57_18160 [Mangrovactinospora gilvigrisea]
MPVEEADPAPQLTERQQAALRRDAAAERARGNEALAQLFERTAQEGFPEPADCASWEDISERLWAKHLGGGNHGHVA